MLNPLDGLNLSRSQKKNLDELEKLAGFSPSSKGKNMVTQLAGDLMKKKETKAKPESKIEEEENRYWNIHKKFAEAYDKNGRAFALFIGDLLDIMLSGPVQARLVSEMIEEKLAKIRKAREAEALEEAAKKKKKYNVGGKISSKYDVEIGGEKRVFSRHFLKRKSFLATLFLDSDEFPAFKKLVKQIDTICKQNENEDIPNSEDQRKEALDKVLSELRYEIKPADVIRFWKLLDADNFKYLDEIFNKTRNLNLVRPTFYDDVDKAYRDGKKLLKLLIKDVQTEFPPNEDKQEAYEDYLKDILEVYTHHHFVLKHFNQTRPNISLKDFELTKEELQEKIGEMRSDADKLKEQINKLIIERDEAKAEARAVKIENEEIKVKLSKLDPAEVRKQLSAAEAKVNAANKELKETLEEDALLRSEFRKLDNENQELTAKLRQLNALPDENANSVEGLMKGKRIVIFGGGSREQYWPTLKEAGVEDSDYEWYEGFHTISQARTNEIVGRCDVAVVMTSYAGHLYLFQVRACINKNQHLFLIHNSGAGTLRTEILKTFGKK
ncbi:MAG: hypothetical protein II961_00800 [Candidatus Riflebacteria bacterium]|nr:hypothetical protein [Candidatus Riflebacteria bacterium]